MGKGRTSGAPLEDVRVVDLLEGALGAFCGSLLASLGADVIKVEPLEGDRMRKDRPFLDGLPGRERSLRWHHFASGRRSIALDLDQARDRAALLQLVDAADVVLENRPVGALEALSLGAATLRARNPGLIVTSMTPFGQTGPRRDWLGGDLVGYAAGGMMSLTGEPDEPPVRLGGGQASHLLGLYGAVGTLVALTGRAVSGVGQRVDVSMQEAVASTIVDAGTTYYQFNNGMEPQRMGTQHPVVVPVFAAPCLDGDVLVNALQPKQWHAVLDWMDASGVDTEVLRDPELDSPMSRLPLRDLINVLIAEAASTQTKNHIYTWLQNRHCPCAPLSTTADLVDNEQHVARGFFREVSLDREGRRALDAGPPIGFERTPCIALERAPLLDEQRDEILVLAAAKREQGTLQVLRSSQSTAEPAGACAGLRVLDFSWALAGPFAGRLLAHEGAEVIRIESPMRMDALRLMASDPERAGAFINANAGKFGLALNIAAEEGRRIALQLVEKADVVLDNFSPGVMDRLGLSLAELRVANPHIITCSMPAQGSTGPHRGYVAYAPVLTALSGFTNMTGFPDSVPTAICTGFIDQLAGANAVLGILAAVHHRDRTGEGQHVEISQFEAASAMLDSAILELTANGSVRSRQGNSDDNAAPHGCYSCVGDDEWAVISVLADDQWTRLARAIERPDLEEDMDLRTRDGRVRRSEEVDAALTQWASVRTPTEVMELLQAQHVPAAAVQRAGDLLERDDHLRARAFYETVHHPVMGTIRLDGAPFRLSDTPGSLEGRGGPLLGQHTRTVLRKVAGLGDLEIEQLERDGLIWVCPSEDTASSRIA